MRLDYWQEDTTNGQVGRALVVRKAFEAGGIKFVCGTTEVANGKKRYTDDYLTQAGHRYAIVEVINEVGSGKTDPYVQASFSYQEIFKQTSCKTSSVLPCLLILVFGPYIAFAGAAWNVRQAIEILSISKVSRQRHPKENVSRHLLAMKKALKTLSDYYKDPLPTAPSKGVFPFPDFYHLEDGKFQAFEYRLGIDASKLLFFGRHPGASHDDLCIKFVRSYSIEAHRFCASKGRAPEILGYRTFPHNCDEECLSRISSIQYDPCVNSIRQTVDKLHKQGFVHGDIRDVNIMAHQVDASRFQIVDWDWAGKNGEARYPPNVNRTEVDRPDGASDGELILPEHDLEMLNFMEKAYLST